ncbi:hypothetical protein A3A56_03835 [Candidatus Roizmanbacteria bacterium RIFCSPLOWO2_01_FULL_40_32]|nr:MAG: hypothetical protein A3A56_03835 [Candidatus Roizmanbacteria bacterium RIFCSPLOWO2_01_FULL_40_32]
MHKWLSSRNKHTDSFFISDTEKRSRKDDLLEFSEIANRFAERVYNQGSTDSLVFGVDAPWGVGKSTFVNFCQEYWEDEYKDNIIVYVFNPLRYESRENLLEKFIDGFIRVIQKHTFIPELRPVISKYSRFIQSVKGNIFGFLNIEIAGGNYSVDDAFQDLETILTSLDKKVIVVIDDLDRLNLPAVKDLLFTIKKSFTLPNVSYVLCYDAENINALEQEKPDFEKVTEFLEKFVNVKVSLYLSSDKLSNFVTTNLESSLSGNSQADPILVSKAVGGLKDIFNSSDYHHYVPFVGDVRKLKRLINTILLLDLEKTDFDNSDINNKDLIHLLLIYINYPNVFRKIYNTETGGKKGFFSLVSYYEDSYPRDNTRNTRSSENEYKNSIKYSEYIKSNELSERQVFLLNRVFDVKQRLENADVAGVSAEARTSYACFNGDVYGTGNKNLEDYLKLIALSSKPQTTDQYRFYLNFKNRLLKGESIGNILKNEAFSFTKNEINHKQLWKIIINSAHEFEESIASQLITYLADNITSYSHFEHDEIGLGLRHDLSFYLVKMLDQAGWVDESGKHRNNTDENLKGIAEWILGEGKHSGKGIIKTLSQEDRGILGIYDLLAFRLFCSSDRGGDIYNLSNALSKHGDPNAPTAGSTKTIAIEEMRIISQKVFQIFKKRYIDKKENIFELIDNLTLVDSSGKYKNFVEKKIKSGEIQEVKQILGSIKSKIKGFLIYQLGSPSTDFGIACGYYDLSGNKDQHEIGKKMNDYLFNICFNPGKNQSIHKNYEHFLDYLLVNFASAFEMMKGRSFIPHINEFTKVLDKEKLYKYWKTHSSKIKKLKFENKDKTVFTPNYKAFYKQDLPDVYKVLDTFVQEKETKSETQSAELVADEPK